MTTPHYNTYDLAQDAIANAVDAGWLHVQCPGCGEWGFWGRGDRPTLCPLCDTVIPPVEALPRVTDGPVEYAYTSGGKPSPPHCDDCAHFQRDPASYSYGWCGRHNDASVCITGGCDQHLVREPSTPFDFDSIEPIPFDDQIKPLPPADLPSGFYELGALLERARLSVNRSGSEELPFDDAPRDTDYDRED